MAIRLKDLVIDVPKTLEGEILLLEEPRVYENYEEGVKTGPGGLAYTCLCEGLNYEKQVIKVAGSITPEIQFEDKPIRVALEGLEGKAWQDFNNRGEIKLSVIAKKIVPVADKPRLRMNAGDKA